MRRKLSQSTRASERIHRAQTKRASSPSRPIRIALLGARFIVLLGMVVGCEARVGEGEGQQASNSSNHSTTRSGSTEATDTTWSGPAGSADASFVWPQDPAHPVFRIELEGAAGEGTIEIELMPELAPKNVAQVLEWVDDGFYAGTTFHRVIEGFMIQGGDPYSRDRLPANDGKGGPGFTLPDEFSSAPFVRGVVGMGNTGRKDSAGSQFFIMHRDQRALDGHYTAIGRVRSGMEWVDAIARVETDAVGRWGPKNRPLENVVMAELNRVDAIKPDAARLQSAAVPKEGAPGGPPTGPPAAPAP